MPTNLEKIAEMRTLCLSQMPERGMLRQNFLTLLDAVSDEIDEGRLSISVEHVEEREELEALAGILRGEERK